MPINENLFAKSDSAHDRLHEDTTTWDNSSNLFWFENQKPIMSEEDRMKPREDPMNKILGIWFWLKNTKIDCQILKRINTFRVITYVEVLESHFWPNLNASNSQLRPRRASAFCVFILSKNFSARRARRTKRETIAEGFLEEINVGVVHYGSYMRVRFKLPA